MADFIPDNQSNVFIPDPPKSQSSGIGNFLRNYYDYLHTETEKPVSFKDFMTRVLPDSTSKTALGIVETPYNISKNIIEGYEKAGRRLIQPGGNVFTNLYEAGREAITPIVDTAKGFGEFVAGPLGLMGPEEAKKRWTTDPIGSLLAVTPVVKGGIKGTGKILNKLTPTIPDSVIESRARSTKAAADRTNFEVEKAQKTGQPLITSEFIPDMQSGQQPFVGGIRTNIRELPVEPVEVTPLDVIRKQKEQAGIEAAQRLRAKSQEGKIGQPLITPSESASIRGSLPPSSEGGTTLYSNPLPPIIEGAKTIGKGILDTTINIGDMVFNPNNVVARLDAPEALTHEFIRKAVDSKISIKDWEATKNIPIEESAYHLEARTKSIITDALSEVDNLQKTWVSDVVKTFGKFDTGLKELSDYVYAKFAPQRNATSAARRAELISQGIEAHGEYGSGMSDQMANDIIRKVQTSGKQATFDKLAQPIWDMGQSIREMYQREGIISPAEALAWKQDGGPFYVPLKSPEASAMIKSYVGRRSLAADPIANMFRQYSNAIVRVNENRIGQYMLDLVEKAKDPNISINEWKTKMKYDPETGQVKPVTEPPWMTSDPVLRDNTFSTLKDGKTYYITFKDNPLLARALNGTSEQMSKGWQSVGSVVRVLSALKTKYSPEFMVTNPFRDILDAMEAIGVEKDVNLAAKVGKDVFHGMGSIYRTSRGKGDLTNPMDVSALEFRKYGGPTGYYSLKDFEGETRTMQQLAARAEGGVKGDVLKAWDGVTTYLGDLAEMTENGIRLSLYHNMRQAGHSIEASISAAKNVTVNFNKQGEWGPRMKALYMFANPSIQGSARFVNLFTHPSKRGKIFAGAAMATALGLNELNRYLAGQDDNGLWNWDKISHSDKTRYLMVMSPNSDQPLFKIPLGFYQRPFFGMATAIDGLINDPMKTPTGASVDVVNDTIDAFNPLGGGNITSALIPSILRPFAEIAMNKTWSGAPMYPESMPGETKARSEKYFQSASELSKAITSRLNLMSGGDKFESGTVDISPNVMDYVSNYFVGDPGVSAARLINMAVKYYDGKPIIASDIPMVRRFTGARTDYAIPQWFHQATEKSKPIYAREKALGEEQGLSKEQVNYSGMGEVGKISSAFSQDYADRKEIYRLIEEDTRLPRDKKVEVLTNLKKEMNDMLGVYINTYIKIKNSKQPEQRPFQ